MNQSYMFILLLNSFSLCFSKTLDILSPTASIMLLVGQVQYVLVTLLTNKNNASL